MKKIHLIDLRNRSVFPDMEYRFSKITKMDETVILERDFIGENPLHYYLNPNTKETVVANSIREIKRDLEDRGVKFLWEHVRAVSNNKKIAIIPDTFYNMRPEITELSVPLQEMTAPDVDLLDITALGLYIRKLLIQSIKERIATIKENVVGLLLSGGLDSISIGYFLKHGCQNKNIRAFTLKANDNDPGVVKARAVAQQLCIDLTEVRISRRKNEIYIDVEIYNKVGILEKKYSLPTTRVSHVVGQSLLIAENPKRDNLFCSIAMYLIGMAIRSEGVKTVFCGEGPNEMINDYGFNPPKEGYPDMGVNSIYFRQALTFGLKEADVQLGRGGLAKHALSRMGKMLSFYGIRLESPFFDPDVANVLTRIPYPNEDYGVIKPKIIQSILCDDGMNILGPLDGISKEKFQDESGVTMLFTEYDQNKLTRLFKEIYGVNKESY